MGNDLLESMPATTGNSLAELKLAMYTAGYSLFAIHSDPMIAHACVLRVYQNVYKGAKPAFWTVLDELDLGGSYATTVVHKLNTSKFPLGIYLTFA